MTDTTARLTISTASPLPDDPDGYRILRAYMAEVASRFWGSAATSAEVDEVLLEDPSDDLVPPTGVFLLARDASGPVGCVAVRRLSDGDCELKRMYVDPAARGRGVGRELVAAAEQAAREFGATTLKLDTRADLVEARTLYVSCGFVEIKAYNDAWYADHWYAKRLR
ncbi:GNAT family N-acetyltransferase [Haloechinothrix halophila]|uniref:GNAT family N-acetyltransferase n=1 Tax=Haloechinothrix halophila TaxID=1069073 RepID=UPI001E60732A|nr:GNAT family N-acetyltransferase [Haloechinothrix halophila]